jgi:hypothetical protein
LGPSSYGSSGCVFVLRVFFFRLCVVFFAGFAASEPASEVFASDALPLPAFEIGVIDGGAAPPAALDADPALPVDATFAALEPALVDDDEPALVGIDEPEPALAEPPALFVVVAEPLPGVDADDPGVDDRPSASKYAPAPASARSTSSTTMMSPMRRFG